MKCWRCGKDNTEVSFCFYCGALQKRTAPVSDYGKALRKIFDDFGYQKVFDDPRIITAALGDLVPDSGAFANTLEYVYKVGLGQLYKSQIKNNGKPEYNFYIRVKKLIIEEAGFSESKADQLISFFDEMIGWESINPSSETKPVHNTNISVLSLEPVSDNTNDISDNQQYYNPVSPMAAGGTPEPAPVQNPSYTPNMPPVTPVGPLLQKTNVLCVVGMFVSIASILFLGTTAIIGLILSIIGLIFAGKKNEKGKSQAIAGIIISSVLIVSLLIGAIIGVTDIKRYSRRNKGPTRRTTEYEETTRKKTSETTEETTNSESEKGLYMTSVGNDKTGKVPLVSGKWVSFLEAGGFSKEVAEHEQAKEMSSGAIIGLFTLDGTYTVEELSKAQLDAMDKMGGKDLTGARVKIGGYDALQAYGVFDDGTVLVVWYFKGDDGIIRKITVEFPKYDNNAFHIVENGYKLDR